MRLSTVVKRALLTLGAPLRHLQGHPAPQVENIPIYIQGLPAAFHIVKNTFAEKPRFADGLPVAAKAGHGFGTQSIRFVTEKLHGSCRFSVENDLFVLQIIL